MGPQRIGKFRVDGPIGEGGMGIVYAAHDEELDRAVAIKVLHPVLVSNKEGKARFRAEARAIGRLRHPGIVQVYQWSEEEEALQFLVMERLEGQSLDQLMARAEFSPPETLLLIAIPLAQALLHAHREGVVHRDVKPANVMVLNDGRVKLMDFGIARLEQGSGQLTITGALVGSPAHMAPEIVAGKRADARSDQFALGTVLYQLATGHSPFSRDNPAATFRALAEGDYKPLERLAPAMDERLVAAITRMMALNPEDRFPDLEAVLREIEPLLPDWLGEGPAELAALLNGPAVASSSWRTQQLAYLDQRLAGARAAHRWPEAVGLANRIVALDPSRQAILEEVAASGVRRWGRPVVIALILLALGLTLSSQWLIEQEQVAAPGTRVVPKPMAYREKVVPTPEAVKAKAKEDDRPKQLKGASAAAVAPRRHELTVRVFPWAELHVKGSPPRDGARLHRLRLPAGTHEIMLRHDRAKEITRRVELPGTGPGGSQALTVRIRDFHPSQLVVQSPGLGTLKVLGREYPLKPGENSLQIPMPSGNFRKSTELVYEAVGCRMAMETVLEAGGQRTWRVDCSSP
ncbi:MAG: hypothetical protein CMH55_03615 [Myxococcales bacterium]|nr:hypothetical protein [Myxococcales bacterium]